MVMRLNTPTAPALRRRRAHGGLLSGLLLSSLFLLGAGFGLAQDDEEAPPEEPAEEEALEPLAPGTLIRARQVIVRPGKVLENAAVHVRDGRIVAVGTDLVAPEGAEVIEGEVVCAGFLDPWSTFGLESRTASRTDTKVTTLATDGLDAFSSPHARRRALAAGITGVGVQAGQRAATGGVGAVVRVAPGLGDHAVVLGDACVLASIGLTGDVFDRPAQADRIAKSIEQGLAYRIEHNEYAYELKAWEDEIAEEQAKLEKDYEKAKKKRAKDKAKAEEDGKEYKEKKHREDKRPKAPKFDADKAVWARVAEGELPLLVQAHRVSELRALLDATAGFGRLRLVVVGGTHALGLAEQLAARKVPVVVWPAPTGSPSASSPSSSGPPSGFLVTPQFGAPPASGSRSGEIRDLSLAGRLHEAGVEVLLGSGGTDAARDLPLLAASAVGHGLDRDAALRALTTGAAKLLDVGDRLGQLRRGYDADLIVLDGPPLASSTRVTHALSAGQVVFQAEAD